MKMNEDWKTIDGFSNYEVSNTGLVRNKVRGNILCPGTNNGYLRSTLRNDDGRKVNVYVHQLVANSFVDGDNLLTVNHIDGNKLNNHYTNLEWISGSDNSKHAHINGLITYSNGVTHPISKLNLLQVRVIRKLLPDLPRHEIASIFEVSKSTIQGIAENRLWGQFFDKDEEIKTHKSSSGFSSKAKLSRKDVIEIKSLITKRESIDDIAKFYSIHPSSVWNIKSGRTYKNISL